MADNQISIAELNTSPDNLARMSKRDAQIITRITYYGGEIKNGHLSFKQALKGLLAEFKPTDANEEHPITQWVKPPLIVMTARTNRDMYWTPISGEKQFLKAGGHVMLSYNKSLKLWDIWGVADEAIESYARGVEPSDHIPEYMDLYNKQISVEVLPKMNVEYSFGDVVEGIESTPFVFAVKAAPAIVFFAESDFELWGLESTEPYQVKKGTPVLIGILFEMWIRKPEDFRKAYLRVDQYAVRLPELLKILERTMVVLAGGIDDKLIDDVLILYTRLSIFQMNGEGAITTADYLKFQTITVGFPKVVPPQ